MKGTGAKRNVCPGSCVSTGAKFPVAPVESAPMVVSSSSGSEQSQATDYISCIFEAQFFINGAIKSVTLLAYPSKNHVGNPIKIY